MTMAAPETDAPKFQIFRAAEARELMDEGCMSVEPFTPVQRAGMDKLLAAGYMNGDDVHVLVNLPGFSLTHVWFKQEYPLPLHSHDTDCLYYIIAGSLRVGTEELGPRDSFFVPADVPYTYKPGAEGVELLEFRHSPHFNFVNHAKGAGFWEKAAEIAAAHQQEWKSAKRPALNCDPART